MIYLMSTMTRKVPTMSFRLLFTLLVVFISGKSFSSESAVSISPSLRFIAQDPSHTFLGQAQSLSLGNQDVLDLSLSYRFRVASHSKLGVRLSLKSGLQHDDDWVNGGWIYSGDRREFIPSLEYQFRFLLPQFPGEKWVGELRTNIDYNTHLGEIFFRPRIGLTYFGIKKGIPLYNIFLRFGPYLKVTNDLGGIYELATYAGFAYNISKNFQLSLAHQFIQQRWIFNNVKETFRNSHVLGINLNVLFNLI